MIIITATLSFETQADRDAVVAETAPVQAATRNEEPGCLAYCFAPDPVATENIQVFELWTDPESVTAHFAHPNYAKMVDVLHACSGYVRSDNQLYMANFRGPVYDENGSFRADAVAADGAS